MHGYCDCCLAGILFVSGFPVTLYIMKVIYWRQGIQLKVIAMHTNKVMAIPTNTWL